MPLYEYECARCGTFELIQKLSDAPLEKCPTCRKSVRKLPSAPAIQFKGTGWYITDYARKSKGGKSKADAAGEGGSADKGASESTKSDSPKEKAGKSDGTSGTTSKASSTSGGSTNK